VIDHKRLTPLRHVHKGEKLLFRTSRTCDLWDHPPVTFWWAFQEANPYTKYHLQCLLSQMKRLSNFWSQLLPDFLDYGTPHPIQRILSFLSVPIDCHHPCSYLLPTYSLSPLVLDKSFKVSLQFWRSQSGLNSPLFALVIWHISDLISVILDQK
jgi:hypothetical protein